MSDAGLVGVGKAWVFELASDQTTTHSRVTSLPTAMMRLPSAEEILMGHDIQALLAFGCDSVWGVHAWLAGGPHASSSATSICWPRPDCSR
jgi:hypothetical protein